MIRIMVLGATSVLVSNLRIEVLDSIRYFTMGMGIALLCISSFSAIEAYRKAWPLRLKYGLTFRWIGRFLMVLFMTIYVVHRLHRHWDWRITPIILACFSFLLIGTWMLRKAEERLYWKEESTETETVKSPEAI